MLTHAARRFLPACGSPVLSRLKASRSRQRTGSGRWVSRYQTRRTRMLTHAARRFLHACGSPVLSRLKASRSRQRTGSGRWASRYRTRRTRMLTHAARRFLHACGSPVRARMRLPSSMILSKRWLPPILTRLFLVDGNRDGCNEKRAATRATNQLPG